MPKSITNAKQLNDALDNYLTTAQQAGVNTSKFAGQVGDLRAQIENLKQAELAKEALKFSQDVEKEGIAVQEFAKGGLTPLQEKLQGVDDKYNSLKDEIEAQIQANKGLADANDVARAAMDKLQQKLADLEVAHTKATAAATAQDKAEQELANLKTQASNLDTSNAIRDLMQQTGQSNSPISTAVENLQTITDDLAKKQIEAAETLKQEQADLAVAQAKGDNDSVARLTSQIDLQQKYYDLVKDTTATQIDAQTKINQAWKQFSDSLSQDLSDMVVSGRFDFQKLFGDLTKLGEDLFVKPFMDQVTSILSSLLKSLESSFAGALAGGGPMQPNQWALVGENGPELIASGNSNLNVVSNGDSRAMLGGSGMTVIQNISTPDVGAFRYARRQLARQAKAAMS
jgi:myosin heavy subunit